MTKDGTNHANFFANVKGSPMLCKSGVYEGGGTDTA